MERVYRAVMPANSVQPVLSVPAGHKYELLHMSIFVGTGTGIQLLLTAAAAGNSMGVRYQPATPLTVTLFDWNAFCLDEGDALTLFIGKVTGGSGSYHLTYMDVDFSV